MLEREKLIKRIAKRKGMDERVVSLVVNYPFKFLRDKISSMTDWRPVRIKYLGVFLLKRGLQNKLLDKNNNIIEG